MNPEIGRDNAEFICLNWVLKTRYMNQRVHSLQGNSVTEKGDARRPKRGIFKGLVVCYTNNFIIKTINSKCRNDVKQN
jgi:hypothetical protein